MRCLSPTRSLSFFALSLSSLALATAGQSQLASPSYKTGRMPLPTSTQNASVSGTGTPLGRPGKKTASTVVMAGALVDQGVANAELQASSIPTLGMLFPISPEFFLDSSNARVGIRTTTPQSTLQIIDSTPVNQAGGAPFSIGPDGDRNLALGASDIMARNNSTSSTLKLQREGGTVTIGQDTPARLVIGNGPGGGTGGQLVIESDLVNHQLRITQNDDSRAAIRIRNDNSSVIGVADIRVLDNGDLSVNRSEATSLPALLDGNGSWMSGSDIRLKTDIVPMHDALPRALAMQPVSYFLVGPTGQALPKRQIGFIAQDVQELFPELVEDKGDFLFMNYSQLGVIAIAALQEQEARTRQELDALRAANGALLARIERLEAGR